MALPVAVAGANQSFAHNAAAFDVALDFSGSTCDLGLAIVEYAPELKSKPQNSLATIVQPAGVANPAATLKDVDQPGTYLVFLRVRDSNGQWSPDFLDAQDAARVHVTERTSVKDWLIPAGAQRTWQNWINNIILSLDAAMGALAPTDAPYLTKGPVAGLSAEINVEELATTLSFRAKVGEDVTPVALRGAAAATKPTLQIEDETGAVVVQINYDGSLQFNEAGGAGALSIIWPSWEHAEVGTELLWANDTGVVSMALQQTGRLRVYDDLVIGYGIEANVAERTTLQMFASLGAGVLTSQIAYEGDHVNFNLDASIATPYWQFGDAPVAGGINPMLELLSGTQAAPVKIDFWLDGANNVVTLETPNASVTTFQIGDRIDLDVEKDILAGGSIFLDRGTLVTPAPQNIHKTAHGDLNIGTNVAYDLVLRANGVDAWKINQATGDLESVDTVNVPALPRKIRKVAEPVIPDDAATMYFVQSQFLIVVEDVWNEDANVVYCGLELNNYSQAITGEYYLWVEVHDTTYGGLSGTATIAVKAGGEGIAVSVDGNGNGEYRTSAAGHLSLEITDASGGAFTRKLFVSKGKAATYGAFITTGPITLTWDA